LWLGFAIPAFCIIRICNPSTTNIKKLSLYLQGKISLKMVIRNFIEEVVYFATDTMKFEWRKRVA